MHFFVTWYNYQFDRGQSSAEGKLCVGTGSNSAECYSYLFFCKMTQKWIDLQRNLLFERTLTYKLTCKTISCLDCPFSGDVWLLFLRLIIVLRTISCSSHAHYSCGGNGEVVWVPFFWPFTNSDQYSLHIRLFQMDISAFSGQNKVTKMCLKYLLTRYYKWSSQYQILINRSGETKQYTKFSSLYRVCKYGLCVQYIRLISAAHDLTLWPSG